MSFILKNVGATYQRAMIAIFYDMMHEELEDYVDDIEVKFKQRKYHMQLLCRILQIRELDIFLSELIDKLLNLVKKQSEWSTILVTFALI